MRFLHKRICVRGPWSHWNGLPRATDLRAAKDRQGLTEVEVGTRAHESRDTDTVAKLLSVTPDWKHHRPEIRFSAASYTAGNSLEFSLVSNFSGTFLLTLHSLKIDHFMSSPHRCTSTCGRWKML